MVLKGEGVMELAATERTLPNLDFAKGETEPGQDPMQCFKLGVFQKKRAREQRLRPRKEEKPVVGVLSRLS